MKKIQYLWLTVITAFLCFGMKVQAAEPVIVIDPGHGGENLGAEYEEYVEKDMNMIVAKAMQEELEKYEGITVYLTRENDKDMTLEERVIFAESVNADFLFCLHFNMSVKHNLFGAEVWISAFGEEYQQAAAFAQVEMDMLTGLGLYSRGIKTKLNDSGEDYYGILRHATARNIPAALIEHCHLDQNNDKDFYTTEEKLKQFGILDATAVAKYYGLKSEVLGIDYSSYANAEIPLPTAPVKPDTTAPDVCLLEVKDVNDKTGEVTVTLSAEDYDSHMLYYDYSYDGGITFSGLQKWEPQDADHIQFTFQVPSGTIPDIVANAYNAFDGFTESNHIFLPSLSYETKKAVEASNMTETADKTEEYKDISDEVWAPVNETIPEDKQEATIADFFRISAICVAIVFVSFLLARVLTPKHSKKKRRRKK